MKIIIDQLTKSFGGFRAVNDISFTFESGQIFGFVGPNGAGKSTTMRILATLDEATDGDCFIDNISVTQDPEKARKLIGYVPDDLPTHRDITVHEYLDFFARCYDVPSKKRKETVESIEEFTNLMGIREKHVNALSKGMKNRVSVARALVHDPAVLIMDEPASGLDPRARIELRELLKVLASQGKAILISSHILTELSEICTGAVFIERGRLLRAGTIQEILNEDEVIRTVSIRPLKDPKALYKHMLELPGIEEVRLEDNVVEVELAGDDLACCELLTHLVSKGFKVLEYKQRRSNLEQIFMNVTRGEVQ